MRYLLDTNVVSLYLRGSANVVRRLSSEKPSDIAISAITAFELHYGVAKRKSQKLKAAVAGFLSLVAVLPCDEKVALRAGSLKADQEAEGLPSGLPDLLIAAHALVLGMTLVTNNTKHFCVMPGLNIEDWL